MWSLCRSVQSNHTPSTEFLNSNPRLGCNRDKHLSHRICQPSWLEPLFGLFPSAIHAARRPPLRKRRPAHRARPQQDLEGDPLNSLLPAIEYQVSETSSMWGFFESIAILYQARPFQGAFESLNGTKHACAWTRFPFSEFLDTSN